MIGPRGARRALGIVAVAGIAGATMFAGTAWAPSSDPTPLTATRTELLADGSTVALFKRCILGSATEPIVFRDGAGGGQQNLPGTSSSYSMVCERALTTDLALAAWREATTSSGAAARKDVTVVVYDAAGAPVARWQLAKAWPTELTTYFDESGVGREIATFIADSSQRVAP